MSENRLTGSFLKFARERVRRLTAAQLLLAAIALIWTALIGTMVWRRHQYFGSFDYDMGIFDQTIWLLARGKTFITVRGLDFWGHHPSIAFYLLAPLSWFGAGPHVWNLLQVAFMAALTIPLFLLGRDRFQNSWHALVIPVALLLNPSMHYMAWEHFHPEVMALLPLAFAYLFARREQWVAFGVCAVLAVSWKEDVALYVMVLGLLIALWGNRKVGAITAVLSLAWLLFTIEVLLPAGNDDRAFYTSFYDEVGGSASGIARTAINEPHRIVNRLIESDSIGFARDLLSPFGFIPLLAPLALLPGLPQALLDVLGAYEWLHNWRWHYVALPVLACAIASIEAIGRFGASRLGVRRFMLGLVAASALATSASRGLLPHGPEEKEIYWAEPDERYRAREIALGYPDNGDAVSATSSMVPHLTRRESIYTFPNPWLPAYWGLDDKNPHDPDTIDWVVVDSTGLNERDAGVLDEILTSGEFEVEFRSNGVIAARRTRD